MIRVLIIAQKGTEDPWITDVISALGPATEVVMFDQSKDAADQFVGVRVVIDQGGHADRPTIDAGAAAGVELWQVHGTGLDHTEVEYILARGIRLANTPGAFSAVALAEHALFLMLCIAKKLRSSDRALRTGDWYQPVNDELAGQTLGLLGLGASGRELAVRTRALSMRVIGIDVARPPVDVLGGLGLDWFGLPVDLPRLLRESDYLSVHVPLTSATRHIIDARGLGLMKPSAVIINVSRGAIVDEEALADSLRQGRLRGAGVDTYAVEPPPPDYPLLALDNVIATPHVAGATYGTSKRRADVCAENVQRTSRGLGPLYEVTARL